MQTAKCTNCLVWTKDGDILSWIIEHLPIDNLSLSLFLRILKIYLSLFINIQYYDNFLKIKAKKLEIFISLQP